MISIQTKKYLGYAWLLIREWDGIDQPQRYRIFKITNNEIDFIGGRFERMLCPSGMNINKILKKKKLIFDVSNKRLEEIINWISENTNNHWFFDISEDSSDCYFDGDFHATVWVFYFEDDGDAFGVKLRWM